MSVPLHEIQGTKEWLDYRRTRGGASEVAALFRCSPWVPRTPLELYEVKTQAREVRVNDAMRHGQQHEAAAREWVEEVIGEALEPQVLEVGRIIASLDGITLDGETVVELKVPPKGVASKTWLHIEEQGAPPDHYQWQVQQQLYVSGAKRCLFAVYDAALNRGITTEVVADPKAHEAIAKAWAEFFEHLDTGTPPPDERPELVTREDEAWSKAAEAYRVAKAKLEAAKTEEETMRQELDALAGDKSVTGAGINLSRYWQKGSVDYRKAVPKDVDLEAFRKPGQWRYRITVEKES